MEYLSKLLEPVLIHYFQSPSTKLSPSFWRVSPSFLSKLLFIFESQENPSYPTIRSMLHLENFIQKIAQSQKYVLQFMKCSYTGPPI